MRMDFAYICLYGLGQGVGFFEIQAGHFKRKTIDRPDEAGHVLIYNSTY